MLFFPASMVYFNCILQDYLYYNMDRGTMIHCALDSCTPSQSKWCALFWCWVSLCVLFTNSFIECYFIISTTIFRILCPFYSFCTTHLSFPKLGSSSSATMQLRTSLDVSSLDILFEYWIKHVTFGLNVMFRFSIRIFYSEVPGFATATDCHCGVCGVLVPWISHLPPVC